MTSRSINCSHNCNQRARIFLGNTRSETIEILERSTPKKQKIVAKFAPMILSAAAAISIVVVLALFVNELRGLLDIPSSFGVEDAIRVLAGR